MLKTIIVLLRILGWVSLAVGVAAAVEILAVPQVIEKLGLASFSQSPWLLALATLIATVVYTIIFFALSEGIQAFLSIECNTRKLRDLLDKK